MGIAYGSTCAAPPRRPDLGGPTHPTKLLAQITATHRQGYAGDIGGVIGGQKQNRPNLLVDAAVAFHQAAAEGLIDDLLVPELFLLALRGRVARDAPWRRFGAARGGGVDANAALGGLEGQAGSQGGGSAP